MIIEATELRWQNLQDQEVEVCGTSGKTYRGLLVVGDEVLSLKCGDKVFFGPEDVLSVALLPHWEGIKFVVTLK